MFIILHRKQINKIIFQIMACVYNGILLYIIVYNIMKVVRTYSITVMLFAVALNICCIIVLCKSKSLQENRFYVLTIYLCITDLGTSLAATVMALWLMLPTMLACRHFVAERLL
jgi:hypothetical protein